MTQTSQKTNALNPERANEKIERIYHEWDAALARLEELPPERLEEGVDALLNLYAQDAVIESPLIPHLMRVERGICHGHEEMRPFFREVGRRKPSLRKYHRTGYLTDGKKVIWEYPRAKPDGEQMDFVEAMELNDQGLIQHHSVYWGWRGVNVILNDAYRR
jgi:SnoaL-like domain